MNYYELLEIQPTASDEVIKMAYKALVKKYHPDVYDGDPEYAKEMLQKVNEAYEILINPESRKKYDRENLSRENVHFDCRNEYREISYPQKRYGHGGLMGILFDFLISVFKFLISCIVLYLLIGYFTGNLKEWNENIVYYSKAMVHLVNNVNIKNANEYEDNSPEKAIELYLQAVYGLNEYEALQQIKTENLRMYELTENIVLTFKAMDNDKRMQYMFNDMQKAEYTIRRSNVENEYVVTVLTCDYELIVNQINMSSNDDIIARKINKKVKIAPKNFKKEFRVTVEFINDKWCVASVEDEEIFIDALTGNLLGNIFKDVIQQMR